MPWRRRPLARSEGQLSSRWNRIALGISSRHNLLQERRLFRLQGRRDRFLLFQEAPDFVPMVVVVSQGRVDVRERQSGMSHGDFFRTHPHPLMPEDDILHADPMAGDPRLAAADARGYFN